MLAPLGAGAVRVIPRPGSARPGLIPTVEGELYWQEFDDCVFTVRIVPAVQPPGDAASVHPAGAIKVNPVSAYWLLAGLLSVNVIAVDIVPFKGEFAVTATEGGLAFAATTVETIGTSTSIPEKSRSARIVPELNFVTYDLEIVFISCFQDGASWGRI